MRATLAVVRPHPPEGSGPRRGRWLAPVLLAILAGCGGQDAPRVLVMNSAPPGPRPPIELDLPRDRSGAFVFDQWPKACDLLSDADIQAVLPQATKVTREPEDQKITLLQDLSVNALPSPPRTVTASGARCSYEVQLPALFRKRFPPRLSVDVIYAGTPEAVKLNFSPLGASDEPIAVPDAECRGSKTGTQVSCRKGSLAFSVANYLGNHIELKDDRWIDRYSVNGQTTTFTARSGALKGDPMYDQSLEEFKRSGVFRRNALDLELAKTVLARI